jgi:hypothetical protein
MRRTSPPPVIKFDRCDEPKTDVRGSHCEVGIDDLYPEAKYQQEIMSYLRGDKKYPTGFHTFNGIRYRIFPVRTKDGDVHPYAYLVDGSGKSFGEKGPEITLNEMIYTPDFGLDVLSLLYQIEDHVKWKYTKKQALEPYLI